MAAADLATGVALPTTLLPTDIVGLDSTTLNSDGSKTSVVETAYGNSLSNLRSETSTTVSANGLVTTKKIDNDGNGVFEQIDTTTVAPDGSRTEVFNYYGDTTATASTLMGTNTYTVSANGLTTTLTTSTGISDSTVDFPDSNGSYQWSRVVTAGSAAAAFGWATGSASHLIDANGIDTWSWNDGYGDVGSIKIDLATEKKDIAISNELFVTLLGHPMDDLEQEYCGQYILNGVFNREQQAYDIAAVSQEYYNNFQLNVNEGGSLYSVDQGYNIVAAIENAFGRLPTAEELGNFDSYMTVKNSLGNANNFDDLSQAAVAIAQYASDQGASNNRTTPDPNANLLAVNTNVLGATAPEWINPAQTAIQIGTAGTYSYTGEFISDLNSSTAKGVTATIHGNNDIILAFTGSNVTVNGYNDSVDVSNGNSTVTASNASVLIESGAIGAVSGSNDQIAQVGPSQLTLSSGTGDTIFVGGGAAASSATYTSANPTTNASNSSITLGAGVSDVLNGSSDSLSFSSGASATVSGSSDTFVFTPNFGQDTLSGFAVSGTGHDVLQLSVADFSYLTPSMSQAADLAAVIAHGGISASGAATLITDTLGDKLTLTAITSTTLTANAGDFVFK